MVTASSASGREPAVALVELPLRQALTGGLGEEPVDRPDRVALVGQDPLELLDVGAVAADVERAEEGELAVDRHRGAAVEVEQGVADVDGVAVGHLDRAHLAVDGRVDRLELLAPQLA